MRDEQDFSKLCPFCLEFRRGVCWHPECPYGPTESSTSLRVPDPEDTRPSVQSQRSSRSAQEQKKQSPPIPPVISRAGLKITPQSPPPIPLQARGPKVK